MQPQRGSARGHDLDRAADLDPAHLPRLDRNHVVDHERRAGVLLHVAVLLALRETAVATDLDCILLCVVAERHRHDVRLATGVGRGDTPEALAP